MVRKTMGLKAGGSGKRFFSSVFLMAFSKSAGTSSAGACCALSGWGGLVGREVKVARSSKAAFGKEDPLFLHCFPANTLGSSQLRRDAL